MKVYVVHSVDEMGDFTIDKAFMDVQKARAYMESKHDDNFGWFFEEVEVCE